MVVFQQPRQCSEEKSTPHVSNKKHSRIINAILKEPGHLNDAPLYKQNEGR